jgi:hypothetical protein
MDRHRLAVVVFGVALAPLTTFRIYGADEIQYFVYLRSAVFDHDLDFADEYRWFVERDPGEYAGFGHTFLGSTTPAGRVPNNAAIGSAALWAPFYLAAVAGESVIGSDVREPRGYSRIDVAAVCIASMIYGVFGLLLSQEACRQFAPPWAAFAATLLLWAATNLPFYMYVTPPMSHACSFFAAALFLWWWVRRNDAPFRLGLIAGLLASVRWQDILFLAVPAVALPEWKSLGSAAELRRSIVAGSKIVLGTIIAFLPQMIVWGRLNGSLTPFGAISERNRFSLNAPYLASVFLSSFHGLFVWTPVLIPAFIGLAMLAADDKRGRAMALGVALQIYLLSGYVHTFAHSFGQRLFISSLPIMGVGLAVFAARMSPRIPRPAFAVGAALSVWWNASLMVQHGTGMIPRAGGVSMRTLVENQFYRVPSELPSIVRRYLFARQSLYKIDPLRDEARRKHLP